MKRTPTQGNRTVNRNIKKDKEAGGRRAAGRKMNAVQPSGRAGFPKIPAVLAAIVIVAVVFLISGGGTVHRSQASNQAEIEANVEKLAALETKSPTEFKDNVPAKILDMEAEREKILAMKGANPDPAIFKRWYEGTAFAGDSIILRIVSCGYLDESVVCGVVGRGLYDCDDVLERAISLQPYVVIIGFGANDMVAYGADTDAFIADYDRAIKKIEAGVPTATIYVNSVMPGQPGNPTVPESFQYCDDYNIALSEYCEENGYTFIDSRFILEAYPELYDDDGFHPTWEFYPMFLTYVGDITGLSKGEIINPDGTLDESTVSDDETAYEDTYDTSDEDTADDTSYEDTYDEMTGEDPAADDSADADADTYDEEP